jgi:hypothetical protein
LLISEGSEASSRLNAVKNTTVPITSPASCQPNCQKNSSPAAAH